MPHCNRMLRTPGIPACILVLGTFLVAPGARAQYDAPPDPAAWVLQDVTVVQADGARQEGMTLVVRAGVIETLAVGAEPPPGARRIHGNDRPLFIFPGMIDADGNASVDLPTPDRDGVESWSPTREVQHLTPHRRAADYLSDAGDGLAAQRRAGFVASVVFPGRGALPGQASLILHRVDARTPRETVLAPSVGLAVAFQGAQGTYPSTLMAVHAFLRQSFLDAAHHRERTAAFRGGSASMEAPGWDEDMEILGRAADGELRVLFRASGTEGVRRVLALADEVGFSPIIVGGEGVGPLAGELADRGVTVLLSADVPEPDEWDPESDEELTPAAARERDRLVPIYETPARLAEAGVGFALTSGGQGGTGILAGVRRFMEYGLSEEDALAALTSVPADLLGAPHLARVQEGAAATFLVTDGPLLEAGTGIVWTFVNGRAEEGRTPRAAESEEGDEELDPTAFVGTWEGSTGVGGDAQPLTLEFTDGPDGLQGRARGATGDWTELRNLELDGDRISVDMPVPEFNLISRLTGRLVEEDTLSGTGRITTPQSEIEFTFELRRSPGGGAS
jgi:imidazolonepropionase-like amidohydrolase